MNRRSFVLTTAAAASAANQPPKPAIEGGAPVRDTPLRAGYLGSDYYDDKERRQLNDVLETKRPFRWYGPGSEPPMKVLTFERELASRMQTRFALAVTSGSAALTAAVAALEIGPGDEVILP